MTSDIHDTVTTTTAIGCCGSAPAKGSETVAAPITNTNPCCGTTAEAQASAGCCGSVAKAAAIGAGADCCE
jgi:hypothetical protein